jgi:hypothetical protein
MSEKFQSVLYYKKRLVLGGKPSLDTVIAIKQKSTDFDEDDMDSILDEYSADQRKVGYKEIVSTYILIYDDENFLENVRKIELDESFVEWDEQTNDSIKQQKSK